MEMEPWLVIVEVIVLRRSCFGALFSFSLREKKKERGWWFVGFVRVGGWLVACLLVCLLEFVEW